MRRTTARRARGDDDAFSDAVAQHHRALARFAFRLCGDRTQAEDLVAEAFARVWPHWLRGRVDDLAPYLTRTVANLAYARHRRRTVERTIVLPSAPPPAGFEDRVDERDELWAALDRLPARQRVVVVLRVVEDLSEDDTAAMLGIPRGTVKSRLARGLDALRAIVDGTHV